MRAHPPGTKAFVDYPSLLLSLFTSHQHHSCYLSSIAPRFYVAKPRLSTPTSATGTMFPLPYPPPGPYNTSRLLDITLATITTVIKFENGSEKEVSCATLRDLLMDFGPEPIPMSIDARWISQLSYAKWATAVVEDMAALLHEKIRPHEGWEIWIPTKWQNLQVLPNERGFRAAIAKWLTWHFEDHDMDITIFMKKLLNEKK